MIVMGAPAMGIITVPNLSAVDLTAHVKKSCNLTRLDSDYVRDFYKDLNGKPISGRGKSFEFLVWNPKKDVTSEAVRKYFQERCFSGHTGAFTAWVGERIPSGYHASIPDDSGCWRGYGGRLFAPCSGFGDSSRILSLCLVDGVWYSNWSFVAFREVPSTI